MVAALLLLLLFGVCAATPDDPEITYEQLYKWGREAYTMESWYDCVAYMKRAFEDYKYYHGEVMWCREMCFRQLPPFTESDGPQLELSIFHRFVERALCLVRCKLERFGSLRPQEQLNPDVEEAFVKRKPYHYLQFCHWKQNHLEHAVQAAYTFLVANPGDKMMGENLGYYVTLPNYSATMLVDLEEAPYQTLYLEGVQAYDEGDWVQAIDKLERALEQYWIADNRCRLECQSSVDWSALDVAPEIFVFIASLHGAVLQCIRECPTKLNRIRGKAINDFIPTHYNYLQFAYWKENRGRSACQAVGTYLLFDPDDDAMLENKLFYENSFATKNEDLFIPTDDAIAYFKRLKIESRSLEFIEKRFKFEDGMLPAETVDDRKPLDIIVPEVEIYHEAASKQQNEKAVKLSSTDSSVKPPEPVELDEKILKSKEALWEPEMDRLKRLQLQKGVQLVKKERELKGNLRFYADNMLTRAECDALLQLEMLAEPGDGYGGQASPHTDHETFRGLSIGRVATLAEHGSVPLETAKMMIDKTELAREFVQAYFNLTATLYIDYTHLACRSANDDGLEEEDRTDLSHPVHADNCVLRENGCFKERPAMIWRDYSAILYLNDGDQHFDGGQFIFTDEEENVQAEVRPACGRMVGFSGDTLHGVRAVRRGTRCALAMWMTLDEQYRERERIDAQQRLAHIDLRMADSNDVDGESVDVV